MTNVDPAPPSRAHWVWNTALDIIQWFYIKCFPAKQQLSARFSMCDHNKTENGPLKADKVLKNKQMNDRGSVDSSVETLLSRG